MSEQIMYRGNLVSRDGFRVYVYGHDGVKKLVNSYEDYEFFINTGHWFDDKPEPVIEESSEVSDEKPKSRRK